MSSSYNFRNSAFEFKHKITSPKSKIKRYKVKNSATPDKSSPTLPESVKKDRYGRNSAL